MALKIANAVIAIIGGIGGAMAGNWMYDQFRGRGPSTLRVSTREPVFDLDVAALGPTEVL